MPAAIRIVLEHIQGKRLLSESELHDALQEVADYRQIDTHVDGLTLAQWAVKAKDTCMIRSLQKHGADLSYALRSAVLDLTLSTADRNDLVTFLLSIGADPETDHNGARLDDDDSPYATLVMKYYFDRARSCEAFQKLRDHTGRLNQMAAPPPKGGNIPHLPMVPELFFKLVGQLVAVHILVEKIVAWAFRLAKAPKPLVLIFCGPSGHGKTDLAEATASLLAGGKEHFHKVSCDQMRSADEIFGLGGAYQGAKEGSSLNNFMRAHSNKPGVVVFDEFEKAEKTVCDTLLNIFDKGEWQDKRLVSGRSQTETVDCNRIVFILTTSSFDPAVVAFAQDHASLVRFAGERILELNQKVDAKLRKLAQTQFSPSFAGRVNSFVPFFPFLSGDVLRDQEVNVLIDQAVQKAFDFHSSQTKNAHCSVEVFLNPKTRSVFADIAKGYYVPVEGVRSVHRCIELLISDRIECMWAKGDIPRDGGAMHMLADIGTDTPSVTFQALSMFWVQKLRHVQHAQTAEKIAISSEHTQTLQDLQTVCNALGLCHKTFADHVLVAASSHMLNSPSVQCGPSLADSDQETSSSSNGARRPTSKKGNKDKKAKKEKEKKAKHVERAPVGHPK